MALNLFNQRAKKDRETHGDRLPPGQKLTDGWPVLHYGGIPDIDLATWKFSIVGLVEEEVHFTWDEFMALPQDHHPLRHPLRHALEQVRQRLDGRTHPRPHIAHQAQARGEAHHGAQPRRLHHQRPAGRAVDDDVLFAHSHDGKPLEKQHGWPLRLVVPKLYFWKSAKWVRGLVAMPDEKPGFWEMYGYHIHGDPWTEERYS